MKSQQRHRLRHRKGKVETKHQRMISDVKGASITMQPANVADNAGGTRQFISTTRMRKNTHVDGQWSMHGIGVENLSQMRLLDLFSGIGGFSLAASWVGNAIVPQVAYQIFKAIVEVLGTKTAFLKNEKGA